LLWHYGIHLCPQVADRGMPSRMDERVAPDKEGAEGTPISNPHDTGQQLYHYPT